MQKGHIVIMIGCCLMYVGGARAVAQRDIPLHQGQDIEKPSDESAKYYEEIFPRAAFDTADTNHDGVLDRGEITAYGAALEPFISEEYFTVADTNGDGCLSIHEIRTQKHIDAEHPEAAHIKLLIALKKKYPNLSQRELRYFFKHTDQAEKLVDELQPGQPAADALLKNVREKIRQEDKKLMERRDVQDKRLSLQEEIIDGRMGRPQESLERARKKYEAVKQALQHK